MALSAISFVLVGCVVYWSGWDTNWKVFGLALAGALLLSFLHWRRGDFSKLHARESAWFGIFVAGLAAISYLGNYGNSLKLLRHGSDMALVTLLSLGVFRWRSTRGCPLPRPGRSSPPCRQRSIECPTATKKMPPGDPAASRVQTLR